MSRARSPGAVDERSDYHRASSPALYPLKAFLRRKGPVVRDKTVFEFNEFTAGADQSKGIPVMDDLIGRDWCENLHHAAAIGERAGI